MWIVIGSVTGILLVATVVTLCMFWLSKNNTAIAEKSKETTGEVFRTETPTIAATEYTLGTQGKTESASSVPSTEKSISISQSELGEEIERIRTYYYSPGEDDKKIVLEYGTSGWNYSRDYRYHDNHLVFAFIYDGTEEHRLYFKDNQMIRYIDENHVTYDYPETKRFQDWADKVTAEAHAVNDNKEKVFILSDWVGTWKADTGESLDITGASDSTLTLVFNKLSEQGNMMHVDYKMEFDNNKKTVASEIGDPKGHGGWEYTFILEGNCITVKSRYPDQYYFKE